MQLKKDTSKYAALKKHEDELIESLRKVDMVSLARSAVENNLVPMKVVSHIQSLDPSIISPHPLICRYLFFHVYATMQECTKEKSDKVYKCWLQLLSDLNVAKVSGVLSRIKQLESCMETMPLHINDIPLLAKVLSGDQFSQSWKQLIFSLSSSKGEMFRDISFGALERLLKKWASKFPYPSIELLKKSLHNIERCCTIEGNNTIENLDIYELVFSSRGVRVLKGHAYDRIDNYGALSSLLTEYSDTLLKYANCLLMPRAKAEMLTDAICTMDPEACLNSVLAVWVKTKFHHAKHPTFTNLVEVLPKYKETTLVECLIREATNRQSFVTIESIWPSSNLGIIEGRSALLEIQVSCAEGSSVAFDWWLENAGISRSISQYMITHRFQCLSVAIVHVDVNSLEMEGTYKCKVKHVQTNKEASRTIQLTVKTPLDEYSNKLTAFHSEQPEVPKDTWPPVSIDSYISLALIKQASITAPSYHTIRGDVDDILSDKEAIMYKAVFDNLDSSTRLLVEGRPGSGKTTLVHKASKDWASGYLKFPHNRLLFLVHLRAFSSNPDVGLHEIIKCYPYSDSTVSTIMEYVERHDGLGLCFILDGLDEYMPGNDSCFIFRLIRRKILPKAVVITASRPAAAANFRQYASKQVEVIGFLTQQIYEYVAKYPFSTNLKCNQLCHYLDQHPRVLHTCYLPIHSAMVCFLFNELKDDLPQTETEIYGEFTKYMILRTLYREGGSSDICIESFDDMAPPQKRIYGIICRLAYEMTTKSEQVMKQTEIKSFFNMKESLGLLTIDRTATRLGFQNMYTFLHLTAQEYLAAYYISKLGEEEQLKVINEYAKQNQMQQVWKFFCGLAHNVDSIQQKFEALLGHSEYGTLYRVQCCFESQLSYFCDAIVEDSSLSFTENFLNSSNFEEIAYVLSNTKHSTVKKLSFDGCIFGKDEVSVLLKKSDNTKLSLITILCYQQCSTEQWDVVKHFVDSLTSLEVLDVSRSHIQKGEIHNFLENLNHPSIKHVQIGSVGCVLHPVNDLNMMLVEESTDKPYQIFPHSISADEVLPVKVLSRELLMLHSELYKKIESLAPLKNVLSASNFKCMYKLLSRYPNLTSFCFDQNSFMGASVLPRTYSSLQRVDVSSNYLGNKGAEAIANILKQCSLLLELNVASNHIGSDGAMALAKALKTCTKLEKLVFHSNDIGTEGVQSLAKSMEHWTNFTSLDVSSNSLTSEAAKVLAIGLKKCPSHTFQQLHIRNNEISDSGFKSLASSVKKCTTLDISSNRISSTGLKAIAGHLRSIKRLDISGNTLYGVDLEKILANCTSLSKLTLGHITDPERKSIAIQSQWLNVTNVIRNNSASLLALDVGQSTKGFEALAGNLVRCMQLQELDVSHTPLVTRDSLYAMSSCLSRLSQLTTLSLSFTRIEQEGTKLLANGLIRCKNLCKLFIDNNNIGDVGAEAIATIIENCHQLQVLDVSSNNIGKLGARSLARALESGGNLCEFNISLNDIKSEGERLLCEAFKHCVNIHTLDFSMSSLAHLSISLKSFTNIQKLQISHNSVNTEHLSEGLKCCKSLQELYASCCSIESLGAIKITSNLSTSCNVLDISNNSIDSLADVIMHGMDPFFSHLDFSRNSQLLRSHLNQCHFNFSKLEALNISETFCGGEALPLLSEGLQHCTILQHLYIARSKFTIHGLEALASILKNFPMLQTLDVSGNNIRDKGAEILADSLQNNPILTTLGIYHCGVSYSGVQALDTALNSDTGRVRTRIEHMHRLPPPVFESNTFC